MLGFVGRYSGVALLSVLKSLAQPGELGKFFAPVQNSSSCPVSET
jgi:hypothetical protein